ncbi:hypothetical protein ACH9EU_03540 [Kocuria sp. M1R5S2]|uniref:hypothetical protein n=1 Tax=Kocuria rhizosphaerae TaxID=3376285 RepID=UPI003795C921
MPQQLTLMVSNILLTTVLAVTFTVRLDGWQWWFPCLWLVGMAVGSLWVSLLRLTPAGARRAGHLRPAC